MNSALKATMYASIFFKKLVMKTVFYICISFFFRFFVYDRILTLQFLIPRKALSILLKKKKIIRVLNM